MNNIIKEIPVTTSGFNIGKYVKFIAKPLGLFLILLMPNAAAVPITVAIIAAITATVTV